MIKVKLNNIDIREFQIVPIDDTENTLDAIALLKKYLVMLVGDLKEDGDRKIFVGLHNKENTKSERIHLELKDDLKLEGYSFRSVYYAVSEFLDRYLGYRFYQLLDIKNVLTEDTNVLPFVFDYTPNFDFRLNFAAGCGEDEAMRLQKTNIVFSYNREESLVGHNAINALWGHTYFHYISPDEYFKTNPEFFSENEKGERIDNGQLCLTNEALFDIVYEKIVKEATEQPNCDFVAFSQNDRNGICQCKKCKTLYKKHKSEGATNLLFVKKLAEKLEKQFPDLKVMTFAYMWSEIPPVGIELPDNVYIFEAMMNHCLEHVITDKTCRFNPKMLKSLFDWSKLTENIYLWLYITDFLQYPLGIPKNVRNMYIDFQIYKKAGIKGIMYQGNSSDKYNFCDLWSYLASKLMWDDNLSYIEYRNLIDEYLENHFGKASKYIREYIDLTSVQPMSTFCYNPYETSQMYAPYDVLPNGERDDTYIVMATQLLDKAYEVAENDEIRSNIDYARLTLDWYISEVTYEDEIKTDKRQYIEKNKLLYKHLKKCGVLRIKEGGNLASESEVDYSLPPHEWSK